MELDESNRNQEDDKMQMLPQGTMQKPPSVVLSSGSFLSHLKRELRRDLEHTTAVIDTVMSFIIVVNAILIGVAAEVAREHVVWIILNFLFTLIFLAEAALRFWLCGWRRLVYGSGKWLELFDLTIVVLDTLQLIQLFSNGFNRSDDSAPVSILRIFRLARLARIGHNAERGAEFFVMLKGLLVGLSTLFWAMIVFSLPVYLGAMFMRETLGRSFSEHDEHGVVAYFNTVPRSMFTMFRCALGDCSTAGGMPVFLLIQEAYGWGYCVFYGIFVFFIAVGLFNVVSAVFVDNVMSASMLDDLALKHRRLSDENLLAANVSTIMRAALQRLGIVSTDECLTDKFDSIQTTEITTEMFEDMLKDHGVVAALNDLDISPEDHDNLFDILDSDNGGTLLFEELLSGLEKLRGQPRRSDIVCVDLMLRSIQQNQNEMIKNQSDMMRHIGSSFSAKSFAMKALTGPRNRSSDSVDAE